MMARPLLPPRGVHVPARMIYHPQLPPAVLQTWIQLRGLAWGGTVTPPLRMQELVALTGKCQASIYQHMSLLRSISALSWRSTGQGTIIVSFADKPSVSPANPAVPPSIPDSFSPGSENLDSQNLDSQILDSQILDSQILESHNPPSLNPHSSSSMDPVMSFNTQESDQIKQDEVEGGVRGSEGERGLPDSQNQACIDRTLIDQCSPVSIEDQSRKSSDPVLIYQQFVSFIPTESQCRLLRHKVTDPQLWLQLLEYWFSQRFNPRDLLGMLDLYSQADDES